MLGPAVGDLLPNAIAVALSPIPIIAVILILSAPGARSTGPAFALGWLAGLTIVGVLVLALTSATTDSGDTDSDLAAWLEVIFGGVFLAMAVRTWSKRPRQGDETALPAWMAKVDTMTPPAAILAGLALSGANPKNLALTAAAGASIAQQELSRGDAALALAIFIALASLSVVLPVLFNLVAPRAATEPLNAVKNFMSHHNTAIMLTVLLILGMKLIGSGLADLTA